MDEGDFKEFLKNPLEYPPEFKQWVGDWFALNLPKIPISQIHGFKLQSMHLAIDVATAQTATSASYQDLATAGPEVTGLSNGFYLALFGAYAFCAAGGTGYMSISMDGSTASDDNAALFAGSEAAMSGGRLVLVDFSTGNHNHSIKAKYKRAVADVEFSLRWVHALKVVSE